MSKTPRKISLCPLPFLIDNVAQAYLELLRDRGVKYFFGNAGIDFAPLLDGFVCL